MYGLWGCRPCGTHGQWYYDTVVSFRPPLEEAECGCYWPHDLIAARALEEAKRERSLRQMTESAFGYVGG